MGILMQPDSSRWDEFLSRTDDANVFQSPAMAKVYSRTRGYRSLVVATETNGQLTALISAALISYPAQNVSPIGTRSIVSGGPLGDAEAIGPLLRAYDAEVKPIAVATQIRNLGAPKWKAVFENQGYRWEDHLNYVVDLEIGERLVFQRMSKGRRNNVKLAERVGPKLELINEKTLGESYRVLQGTYSRARVPLADIGLFESALQVLVPKGLLWPMAVRHEGRICAVVFLLRWSGTAFNWYNGSTEDAWRIHANEWLFWQAMRESIVAGCARFDFGGAGRPGEPYGPGLFKQHFGGTRANQGRYEKVHHPYLYRASMVAYTAWRRMGEMA